MEKRTRFWGCILVGIASVGILLPTLGRVILTWGEIQNALQSPQLDKARQLLREGILLFQEEIPDLQGEAIPKLEQAAIFFHQAREQRLEAFSLKYLGLVYSSLGEKQKALEYYNQALTIFQVMGDVVGDRRGEAGILNNIGRVYFDLEEKQKALEYYNQALNLFQVVSDLGGEADILNQFDEGEADILNNIGRVYFDLGEKQKALEYFGKALNLVQVGGDRVGEADILNNIGRVYFDLGEKQRALEYFEKALNLHRQSPWGIGGQADTLNNIGRVYFDLGEKQKALEYFEKASASSSFSRDRGRRVTDTYNNIGRVYFDLGEKQKALEYFELALSFSQNGSGNRSGEALSLYNIAFTQRSQGNLEIALTEMEKAIAIIEELRTRIDSQNLRASYFATVQDYYQFYIDLLMQLHQQNPDKGYNALALHVSERSRARGLLELLTEAGANIRQGIDPKLLAQEQNLLQKLNALEQHRYNLASDPDTQQQARDLVPPIQNLLEQLDRLEGEIRTTSSRYASLKYPQPLTPEQIQEQILDEETVLLKYALGDEQSYLWMVTKNGTTSHILQTILDL
ncbi:MAG: tetratricopeptide repeat protein [Spirulina sp.]